MVLFKDFDPPILHGVVPEPVKVVRWILTKLEARGARENVDAACGIAVPVPA